MWRKATKFDILRKATATRGLKRSSCIEYLKELSQDSIEIRHFSSKIETNQGYKGFGRSGEVLSQIGEVGRYNFMISRTPFGTSGVSNQPVRHYATAAAEPIVSTSSEEDEEVRELISETSKQQRKHLVHGIPLWRYNALRKRQIQVETEAWNEALREYRELLSDMCEKRLAPNLPYVKSLFLGWFEPLRDAIKVEQDLCKNKNKGHAPYFDVLPADMMAVITMHKLMGLLMSSGGHGTATLVRAAVQIGEAIEHEAKLRKLLGKSKKKSTPKDAAAMEQEILGKKVTNLMKKQKGHLVKRILKEHDNSSPWGQDNQAKVGSRLIQLLIETAYIQPPADQLSDTLLDIRPAFIHTKRFFANDDQKGGRKYGVIECDPMVRKGLENSARHTVIPYMPMLVPPLDWRGYDKGAYFFLPSYIMRSRGARQQRQALQNAPKQQLEKVYKALNILGNTKWRVNKKVLSIIERIWASGGRLADLVDRQDLAIPEEPDTDEETAIRNWKREVRNVKKENKERHSQRCDVELKLKVARTLKDEEGFYYPHNLDFRGRAYPLHPHLNHLGSDLCRGILEFAEGRPLRASGLRWLKIHMANLYAGGVDKLSYEGRAAFTENHLDDIFDSADRPLEGKRWWLQAEDPFQCLAACMNLTEALRSSSPEDYVSHMPVHQDGSCNGLQHYAALGRDKLGAKAVNLVAGDKPADVYSNIAKSVHEMMLRDAEKDPSIEPNVSRAKLLLNQVDRKLVKQTVMTSVYGVTYMGARDQIKKRLKERGAIADDNEVFGAACYAAKVTLTALEEMFEAARSIMNWLGECAKVIASENETVQWTTPIGLPVVQPYRKIGKHLVSTSLQTLTLQRETDKIMRRRQRTAFPPNFVHSLDGTHMMMTAIACNESGLNFAGVHDSYWTHACDVDEMNKILREKFVELYDQPILEMLLDSFEKSLPHVTFPPLPERGDFDIRDVLDSRYFFN